MGSELGSERGRLIDDLSRRAEHDESVLAAILVGSVPRGYGDEISDVDLELVVTPRRYEELAGEGKRIIHTEEYDLIHTTLNRIKEAKESQKDDAHWPYMDCRILFDKTEVLWCLLEDVARYDHDTRVDRLKEHYLSYWGNMLQAISCMRRKKTWEARIFASLSVKSLVSLVYNLNGRWAPEIKWASKEFDRLEKKPDRLEERIAQVLTDPDIPKMSELWKDVARLLREEGYTWIDRPEQVL